MTDQEGKIGERRAGRVVSTAPAERGTGRVAAGTASPGMVAAPVQNPDMQIGAERVGHEVSRGEAPPAAQSVPARAPAAPPNARPAESPTYARAAQPVDPSLPTPPQRAPDPPTPSAPYKPEKPFSRGVNKPGASRFISGTRRR